MTGADRVALLARQVELILSRVPACHPAVAPTLKREAARLAVQAERVARQSVLLVALGLAACSAREVPIDPSRLDVDGGVTVAPMSVRVIEVPNGPRCVVVTGYRGNAVSCDWLQRL